MATQYTHTTWGQFKTALSLRLGDSAKVYWSDGELGYYLTETLRTWSLLTGFWRDIGVLNTANNTPFYDLTTLNNSDGDALLSYTVRDQYLVLGIQYHLLELDTGDSFNAGGQFTLADVTNALQKRRDQFIADTGCVVTRTTGISFTPNSGRVDIADTVIDIRRLAFVTAGGVVTPLFPTDIMSQRNYSSEAVFTPGDAYSFSFASARPLELILVPPPSQPGTFDLISTQTGVALDPTGAGTILGVPDDYSWAIKWGAMADLLAKDGPARDPIRSAYCERRYQLGVELVKIAPVIINSEINGVPLDADSLTSLDSFNSSWQSTTGTPDSIASIRTLVGLAPCPDGVYSLTFDVVSKCSIPAGIIAGTTADDAEFVQVGREQLDALLDYAEHLALFKDGGEEFRATLKGAGNFFKAAVAYNERLAALNPNALNLMVQSFLDDEDRQPRVPGGIGALQGLPTTPGSATIDQSGPTNPEQSE